MTMRRTQAETWLDLEGIEEENALWVIPLGVHPDRLTSEGLQEEVVEVEESDQKESSISTHIEVRPLVKDRDSRGVNKCLKVTFEDVIAEPRAVRSFNKVWMWSHILFEVSRLRCYQLISVVLAVPVSLVAGILFAVLSCIHIWLIKPSMQLLLINMHWAQTVWGSVLNIAFTPFFKSMGKCCGSINVQQTTD